MLTDFRIPYYRDLNSPHIMYGWNAVLILSTASFVHHQCLKFKGAAEDPESQTEPWKNEQLPLPVLDRASEPE